MPAERLGTPHEQDEGSRPDAELPRERLPQAIEAPRDPLDAAREAVAGNITAHLRAMEERVRGLTDRIGAGGAGGPPTAAAAG